VAHAALRRRSAAWARRLASAAGISPLILLVRFSVGRRGLPAAPVCSHQRKCVAVRATMRWRGWPIWNNEPPKLWPLHYSAILRTDSAGSRLASHVSLSPKPNWRNKATIDAQVGDRNLLQHGGMRLPHGVNVSMLNSAAFLVVRPRTMDLTPLLYALILGIVEGLTEFLPISSTGHLILAGDLLRFNDERGKLFLIVIQSGAILAVCWEYRARIAGVLTGLTSDPLARRLVRNLAIAFMPLAILGLLFKKSIEANLFKPLPVAMAFIVGALVILWAEKREHRVRINSVDELSAVDALKLGIAQAFALIPGTSRSGATIIGGLLFGLSRKAATEFSFFLAIPTLLAATVYLLYKERALLSTDDLGMWAVGFVAAFMSAFLCVRWLLRFISTHDFTVFAWYRIVFGIVVIATWQLGLVDWTNA
jgi:undecaprenyl-diphosphatase